jgi:hypothetical protein
MRHTKTLLAALLAAGLAGGGLVYAQAGAGSGSGSGSGSDDLPEATASGETEANLSPREMQDETKKMLDDMEKMHARVLELQAAARKAKDVIKLNCVNEKLLAVKQLLNIGDAAQTDLTEAISGGDRAGAVHQYSQVKLAHERTTAERDDAEGCIGEELVFIGPTKIDVTGPSIPDDPTKDPHDPFSGVSVDIERPVYATPF